MLGPGGSVAANAARSSCALTALIAPMRQAALHRLSPLAPGLSPRPARPDLLGVQPRPTALRFFGKSLCWRLALVQRPERVCCSIGTLRPGRSSLPLLGPGWAALASGSPGLLPPVSPAAPRADKAEDYR